MNICMEKKKSKPGRAARRRKAKERSINEALNQLLNGSCQSSFNEDSSVPMDRSESLPGVLSLREKLRINLEEDKINIISQLGFLPGNTISVASRVLHLKSRFPYLYSLLIKNRSQNDEIDGSNITDQDDYPTTLQLYPLAIRSVHFGGKQGHKFKSRKRGHSEHLTPITSSYQTECAESHTEFKVLEPFPTMYWLTHPILRVLISRIELGASNNVVETENRLLSSESYLLQMRHAHESYGRTRWDLLTEEDKKDVMQRKWADAIGNQRGIAGIQRYDTVKCLHTHAAHYLATIGACKEEEENIVGRWVLEIVENDAKFLN